MHPLIKALRDVAHEYQITRNILAKQEEYGKAAEVHGKCQGIIQAIDIVKKIINEQDTLITNQTT